MESGYKTLADWGITSSNRIGIEFRLVNIPAGQEDDDLIASGFVDFEGSVGNGPANEIYVKNLLMYAFGMSNKPEPSIFIGIDII